MGRQEKRCGRIYGDGNSVLQLQSNRRYNKLPFHKSGAMAFGFAPLTSDYPVLFQCKHSSSSLGTCLGVRSEVKGGGGGLVAEAKYAATSQLEINEWQLLSFLEQTSIENVDTKRSLGSRYVAWSGHDFCLKQLR